MCVLNHNKVICDEYDFGPSKARKLLHEIDFKATSETFEILEGKHQDKKIEEEYKEIHRISNDNSWEEIPMRTPNAECVINRDKIYSLLESELEDEDVYNILQCAEKNLGDSFLSSRVRKNFGKNIKNRLPTFHNICVYEVFKRQLTRKANKNEFTIKIDPPIKCFDRKEEIINKEWVVVKKNFLSDIRIGMLGLEYMDVFLSSDRDLIVLLLFLYPHYNHKIWYWCKSSNSPKIGTAQL